MDLNRIIQEYKISKKGGEKELRQLQERLKGVPVKLTKFKDYLY